MFYCSILLCLLKHGPAECNSHDLQAANPGKMQRTPGAIRVGLPSPRSERGELILEAAAAHLAQGRENAAIHCLEQYLEIEPRHLFIRAQVAELHFRQKHWPQSRRHFHWTVGLAQEFGDDAYNYLIHAHSRLVDLGEVELSAFEEHLHRGIGLFELASRRKKTKHGAVSAEVATVLGRAAASLQTARDLNPTELRPHWYLYLVWTKLGQHDAARQALGSAERAKFLTEATPFEKRSLDMALWTERFSATNR